MSTRVAILDSGAGGLSILQEILRRDLNCNTTYLADLKYLPYGEMPEDQLSDRVEWLTKKLIETDAPDTVIIGCNTASTAVLDKLRARWNLPFIGVVPAIKPAAEQSRSKHIGVLATPATTERPYIKDLINRFAADVNVKLTGSTRLVDECEFYLRTGRCDPEVLNSELDRLIADHPEIDCVVLACTHFALLKPRLEALVEERGIRFVDSTEAIVNRLESLQPTLRKPMPPYSTSVPHRRHFISTDGSTLEHYARFLSLSEETVSFSTY